MMKIKNKLKAVSSSAFCLVISLWSETKGVDNQTDILEGATVNCTASIQSLYQSEINGLAVESTASQFIKLEDTQTSWASYLLSPLRSTISVANEFVSLVTDNPKLAIVIGLSYGIQGTAAACNCIWMSFSQGTAHPFTLGMFPNETSCRELPQDPRIAWGDRFRICI